MSHLNMAQIQELKDVMEDGFSDLVMTYIEDSDHKIISLREAIAANDCAQVADVAHSLKGSSANICAEALSSLFKTIEDSGRAQELAQVPDIFGQVEEEFVRVKHELQELK
jgi:HPt (histidine-containing phosphotransfer) domain-containing protein